MALQKASNQKHPAALATPGQDDKAVDLVVLPPPPPLWPAPVRDRSEPAKEQAGAAQRTPQSGRVPEPQQREKAAEKAAPRSASARQPASGGGSRRAVRRPGSSPRGKRDVTFGWPEADATEVLRAFRRLRRPYKQLMAETDPDGVYALTQSNLTAVALQRALQNPARWLSVDTVHNDARRESSRPKLMQVGLTWPTALLDSLGDAWETLDAEFDWPPWFRLTKANLALAGILSELPTAQSWLADVPNDDRYSEPLPEDGRTQRYAER